MEPLENAVVRLTLDGTGYLDEVRALGVRLRDFQDSFPAAPTDGCTRVGVGKTGLPLLWLSAEREEVVVDETAFSALEVKRGVMARYLEEDQTEVIGRVLGDTPRRDLVVALIQDHVIHANQHMDAELYLVAESEGDGGYRSTWISVDTFYTNEKNVETYSFGVRVDLDGRILFARGADLES